MSKINPRVLVGDCRERLKDLPDNSIHTVVTSPPYWGLRDYGTAKWEGGNPDCEHKHTNARPDHTGDEFLGRGAQGSASACATPMRSVCDHCGAVRIDSQVGLEDSPDSYVGAMVEIFREVRRVLRDDGTLWLNLGDSYAANRPNTKGGPKHSGAQGALGGSSVPVGLKPKDLVGIPWRVALALQEDGWVLRSDIIWHKVNPLPESVTDRPTKSHEYVFMFSKGRWSGPPPDWFAHIKAEDARWLALFLDTEGNISIKRSEQKDGGFRYGAQLCFANTNRTLLETAHGIIGKGTILQREGKNAPMFYLQLANRQASALLRRLYPYLIVKNRQARIAIHLQSLLRYRGGKGLEKKSRSLEETSVLESLWARNKECNRFGDPDLSDVPEPRYGKWHSQPYFYDAFAIMEEAVGSEPGNQTHKYVDESEIDERHRTKSGLLNIGARSSRNKRTVWTIATKPFKGAHFACMPPALAMIPILAGTSDKGACATCGAPWKRIVDRPGERPEFAPLAITESGALPDGPGIHRNMGGRYQKWLDENPPTTVGWEPTCKCDTDELVPCTVLDPFAGAGTTLLVSRLFGRASIGVELNPKFAKIIEGRIRVGLEAPEIDGEMPSEEPPKTLALEDLAGFDF